MDISQAPQEITIGKLPRGKELKQSKGTVPVPRQRRTQYTEIARKEKVGSSREKLSRGKELKPSKEIAKKEKVGSSKKNPWAPKPLKAIPKKEKVHCRKKKLPLKSTTPEELCEFYTPDELCEVYTSDELRRTFGLPKLYEMLPRHKLALMVFPRPKLRLSKTEDGKTIVF
ncbi:hypothetical protein P8452_28493 [Trifolium repens]|nr:hypothetical protein P8452_28493 [Trifolium repens]